MPTCCHQVVKLLHAKLRTIEVEEQLGPKVVEGERCPGGERIWRAGSMVEAEGEWLRGAFESDGWGRNLDKQVRDPLNGATWHADSPIPKAIHMSGKSHSFTLYCERLPIDM